MLSIVIMLSYASALIAVLLSSSHVLSVLVLMEYMVIMVFCMLLHQTQVFMSALVLVSLFVVTVTSAALGLALLASLSRVVSPTQVLASSITW